MVKIVNDCVGPCPQGCMGSCCPNRHVPYFYCDVCGEDVDALYDYECKELCEECVKKLQIPEEDIEEILEYNKLYIDED